VTKSSDYLTNRKETNQNIGGLGTNVQHPLRKGHSVRSACRLLLFGLRYLEQGTNVQHPLRKGHSVRSACRLLLFGLRYLSRPTWCKERVSSVCASAVFRKVSHGRSLCAYEMLLWWTHCGQDARAVWWRSYLTGNTYGPAQPVTGIALLLWYADDVRTSQETLLGLHRLLRG
jgi:hypothetical protein